MALPDLTGLNIEETYQRVVHTDGADFYDGTGSLLDLGNPPKTVTETVKNISGIFLPKGTPIHATGSGTQGNLVGAISADAGDPTKMPATYVLNEDLENEQEGEAIAVGFIQGVNTEGLIEGEVVYVGVGGGWTQTKPTGSALIQNLGVITKAGQNGSGVVLGAGRSNDIPNIQPGHIWVGDENWVPKVISTSSIEIFPYTGNARINGDLTVTGTGSFAEIRVSNIKGNSPLKIQDITELVFNNANLYGNPIFHGDVNIYNQAQLLDEEDHPILQSTSTGQGEGEIVFGNNFTIPTKIEGTKVILYNNTEVTGSLSVSGSLNLQLPTSSTDTHFITYNTSSFQLEAREVATLINPKVEYLDLTASISSGTSITLPNNLSYISSSTYEYLEVFFNGLRLRYDRDFIPTSTTTIQTQIAFPSGSELTFKSLKA